MGELVEVDVLQLARICAVSYRLVVSIDNLRGRTVAGRHDIVEFAGVEIHAGRLHFPGFEFDFGFQLDQRQIVSVLQSPLVVGRMIVNLFRLVEGVGFQVFQ